MFKSMPAHGLLSTLVQFDELHMLKKTAGFTDIILMLCQRGCVLTDSSILLKTNFELFNFSEKSPYAREGRRREGKRPIQCLPKTGRRAT